MTEVLSPCFSDCDSVSGLLEKEINANKNKPSKFDILNQVVQTFRLPKTRNYSSLGSCPNLARLSSKTLLLKENIVAGPHNNNDKLLNVNTPYGTVRIYKTGNSQGPHLVTLHDIGLNGFSNFHPFWESDESHGIVSKFCVINLSLPGQEAGADSLAVHYSYPSMEELTSMVEIVLDQLQVKHCVMMGVGLGGYLALSVATKTPKLVDGLILVNANCSSSSWTEWACHKVNMTALRRTSSVPDSVIDYLIWHHFGAGSKDRNSENFGLVSLYRQHLVTELKPSNLFLLIQSYVNRKELNISTIRMPILNMVGENSPHVDATININTKVEKKFSTWMKINKAGMVLEEQPGKVAEAMSYFLQGLGYTLKVLRSRSSISRPKKLDLKGSFNFLKYI